MVQTRTKVTVTMKLDNVTVYLMLRAWSVILAWLAIGTCPVVRDVLPVAVTPKAPLALTVTWYIFFLTLSLVYIVKHVNSLNV